MNHVTRPIILPRGIAIVHVGSSRGKRRETPKPVRMHDHVVPNVVLIALIAGRGFARCSGAPRPLSDMGSPPHVVSMISTAAGARHSLRVGINTAPSPALRPRSVAKRLLAHFERHSEDASPGSAAVSGPI